MKRVLVAHPAGARLYEMTDAEYDRFEHVLGLQAPHARGAWARRFLSERVPATIFPPGTRGLPDDLAVDRAIGGNAFTPKWGKRDENRPL